MASNISSRNRQRRILENSTRLVDADASNLCASVLFLRLSTMCLHQRTIKWTRVKFTTNVDESVCESPLPKT